MDRLDRGPIADEHFLACAETVFAATHRAAPWNHPEPIMAGALARFRRDSRCPGPSHAAPGTFPRA